MHRFKAGLFLYILLAVFFQATPITLAQSSTARAVAPASSASRRSAEKITAEQLRDYLNFVSSDEMEGRDTPSRGLDLTAKFIATNLSRWGIKPAGDDGTYFQKITLRRTTTSPTDSRVMIGGQTFSYGDGFLAAPIAADITGAMIFAGHGWVVNGKKINPYEGLDVKDKIIVVTGNIPVGITSFVDLGGKKGVDWFNPSDYAKLHNAKAVLTLPNAQSVVAWDAIRQIQTEKGVTEVERFLSKDSVATPTVTASMEMARVIFQGEKAGGTDMTLARLLEFQNKGFALDSNKTVAIKVGTKIEKVGTQNVVGLFEGSDEVLKKEYVALGAHYDHIGTGPPSGSEGRFPSTKDKTDFIYNGADDDGSGTVAVLAMAHAFASNPRPKRSILFVWHCGEEKGLWGSRYYTETPSALISIKQIVAQLNLDMIGRSKPEGDTNPANKELAVRDEIYVIGSKMMSTELGELSERINASYLNLKLNYKYDDPNDPNQFFFRSDHFHYAKNGIPIIFYTDGEHEDYHRPSDTADRIDYEQMTRITRTIYLTATAIANAPSRPRVDKTLPFKSLEN
jgi:Zn-dependent M28 family amino/carboxypeptidase